MIIESFEVRCSADDAEVFALSTVFGYFPSAAFDNQTGLPVSEKRPGRVWRLPATTRSI